MTRKLNSVPSFASVISRLLLREFRTKFTQTKAFANDAVQVDGAKIDLVRLKKYRRLCGFDEYPELPITYPQVLAFPLMYDLFLSEKFPGRMLGLVHKFHEIEQLRPINQTDQLSITCRTESCEPSRHGFNIEVVSEILVEGHRCWTSKAIFLLRAKQAKSIDVIPSTTEKRVRLPSVNDFPVDATHTVAKLDLGKNVGRHYASVSMDYNPIHLNTLAAKAFGFQSPIAHGLYLLARAASSLNPNRHISIEFKAPVYLPNTLALITGKSSGQFKLVSERGAQCYAIGNFD